MGTRKQYIFLVRRILGFSVFIVFMLERTRYISTSIDEGIVLVVTSAILDGNDDVQSAIFVDVAVNFDYLSSVTIFYVIIEAYEVIV